MTYKIKNKIADLLLLTLPVVSLTACSDTDSNSPVAPDDNQSELISGSQNAVSIDFVMERDNNTRAWEDYLGASTGVISSGSLIDMLVFAVYDSSGKLLGEFSRDDYASITIGDNTLEAGKGQNIIECKDGKAAATLAGMTQGETYSIVAWAQSSKCDAYDYNDLENVKINYKDSKGNNGLNNDETRDAFCASVKFTVPKENQGNLTVELKRPFAQINVGTTGADFRVSAKVPGGTYYTYSQISFKGLANSLNVYTGKTGEGTVDITYNLNKIPAYWNMDVPSDASSLDNGSKEEEYLQVELDKKDGYLPYKTTYSTVRKDKDGNIYSYQTETFKYMSMCYVLVPGNLAYSTKASEVGTGSSITEVSVMFSGDKNGNEISGVNTTFTLTNLPAMGNYRTNILGGLHDTTETGYDPQKPGAPGNPANPEKPDETPEEETPSDPSTLFNSANIQVQINVEYLGDKEPQILK